MFTFENVGTLPGFNIYGLPNFTVPATPDVPFTPRIVFKNSKKLVGILNSAQFAPVFIDENKATPITSFGNPPFGQSAVYSVVTGTCSAIAHESL